MDTATTIIEALGGWDNISNLEACITRIRLDAANTDLIDEAKLREAGAFDVVIVGDAVQVVMGPDSEDLVAQMNASRRAFSSVHLSPHTSCHSATYLTRSSPVASLEMAAHFFPMPTHRASRYAPPSPASSPSSSHTLRSLPRRAGCPSSSIWGSILWDCAERVSRPSSMRETSSTSAGPSSTGTWRQYRKHTSPPACPSSS